MSSSVSTGTSRQLMWWSWSEYLQVCSKMTTGEMGDKKWAVDRINAWRSRGKLPVAIDCAATLLETIMSDRYFTPSSPESSEIQLRMQYGMSITRTVNALTDLEQKAIIFPVASLADNLGLPSLLVDIRHRASHQDMPSISVCRQGAVMLLQYMEENFWQKQMDLLSRTAPTPFTRADAARHLVQQFSSGIRVLAGHLDDASVRKTTVGDVDLSWARVTVETLNQTVVKPLQQWLDSPHADQTALVALLVGGVLPGVDPKQRFQGCEAFEQGVSLEAETGKEAGRLAAYWAAVVALVLQRLSSSAVLLFFSSLMRLAACPDESSNACVMKNSAQTNQWGLMGEDGGSRRRGTAFSSFESATAGISLSASGDFLIPLFPGALGVSGRFYGPVHRRFEPAPAFGFPLSTNLMRRRVIAWLHVLLAVSPVAGPVEKSESSGSYFLSMLYNAAQERSAKPIIRQMTSRLRAAGFRMRALVGEAGLDAPLLAVVAKTLISGGVSRAADAVKTATAILRILGTAKNEVHPSVSLAVVQFSKFVESVFGAPSNQLASNVSIPADLSFNLMIDRLAATTLPAGRVTDMTLGTTAQACAPDGLVWDCFRGRAMRSMSGVPLEAVPDFTGAFPTAKARRVRGSAEVIDLDEGIDASEVASKRIREESDGDREGDDSKRSRSYVAEHLFAWKELMSVFETNDDADAEENTVSVAGDDVSTEVDSGESSEVDFAVDWQVLANTF